MYKFTFLSDKYILIMPVPKSHNVTEIRPLCESPNKVSIDGPPVPKIFDSSIIRN